MRSPLKFYRDEIAKPGREIRTLGHPEKGSELYDQVRTLRAKRRWAIFKLLWPAVVAGMLTGGAITLNARRAASTNLTGGHISHNFEPLREYDFDGGPDGTSDEPNELDGGPSISKETLKLLNRAGEIPLSDAEAENHDNSYLTRIVVTSMNIGVDVYLRKHGNQHLRDIYSFYRQHAVPMLYTQDGQQMQERSTDPQMFYFDRAKKDGLEQWKRKHDLCYFDPEKKTLYISDPVRDNDPPPGADVEKAKMKFSINSALQTISFLLALNDAHNCMLGNCGKRFGDQNVTDMIVEADILTGQQEFLSYLEKYKDDEPVVIAAILWGVTKKIAEISFEPDQVNSENARRLRGQATYLITRWLLSLADKDPKVRPIKPQLMAILGYPSLITSFSK